jgi:hypothetical protein
MKSTFQGTKNSFLSAKQVNYGTFSLIQVKEDVRSCVKELKCDFIRLQGDLDRQRLLGDRPREGLYESVLEDGLEGIEHQERFV